MAVAAQARVNAYSNDTSPSVHSGNTGVSAGYAGFLQERGIGVAIGCTVPPMRSPEELAVQLLATLTDTSLSAVSPRTDLDWKLDRVPGQYASDGGFHTVTVAREGPELFFTQETPLGGREIRFRPRSFGPNEYTFVTLEDDGIGDDRRVLSERREVRAARRPGSGTAR